MYYVVIVENRNEKKRIHTDEIFSLNGILKKISDWTNQKIILIVSIRILLILSTRIIIDSIK